MINPEMPRRTSAQFREHCMLCKHHCTEVESEHILHFCDYNDKLLWREDKKGRLLLKRFEEECPFYLEYLVSNGTK